MTPLRRLMQGQGSDMCFFLPPAGKMVIWRMLTKSIGDCLAFRPSVRPQSSRLVRGLYPFLE
jgi:hypothetical protein